MSWLDGSGLLFNADGITIIVAVIFAGIQCRIRHKKGFETDITDIATAGMNCSAIFPFFLIFATVFHEKALAYASTSKVTLASAGAIGLLYALGEVFAYKKSPRK